MASPGIWPSSNFWWISQQDFNILVTCMDYHATSPPFHLMIFIVNTLFYPISLVAFNLSSHFTTCLHHLPWVTFKSFVIIVGAYPSHQQHLCVPCPDCDYICRSRFGTSPNIMHSTHVIISFRGVDAFCIIIFSSSFDLDMDCIIRYEQRFPFWFTTPQLIPLYSICSSCWRLICFAYPFNSIGHWSIQHNKLACIFALLFLVFFISTIGWWERPPRYSHPITSIHGKNWETLQKEHTLHIFIHWLKLMSLFLSMILIHRWILFWIERHFFCFDAFTTSFIQQSFEYGVWTLAILFCPWWFC